MRWPWRRRHDEDLAALEEAQRQLAETRNQWPRVEAAAEEMRQHKERNHFAENIAAIYEGRRR